MAARDGLRTSGAAFARETEWRLWRFSMLANLFSGGILSVLFLVVAAYN